MTEHRVDPTFCPKCGTTIDTAHALEDDLPPNPEDLTVCFECMSILRFDNNLELVRVTASEFQDFDPLTQQNVFETVDMLKTLKEVENEPD